MKPKPKPTKTCTTCTGWTGRKCHNVLLLGKPSPMLEPVRHNCAYHTTAARQMGLEGMG